jgi:hypothetical protein
MSASRGNDVMNVHIVVAAMAKGVASIYFMLINQ